MHYLLLQTRKSLSQITRFKLLRAVLFTYEYLQVALSRKPTFGLRLRDLLIDRYLYSISKCFKIKEKMLLNVVL